MAQMPIFLFNCDFVPILSMEGIKLAFIMLDYMLKDILSTFAWKGGLSYPHVRGGRSFCPTPMISRSNRVTGNQILGRCDYLRNSPDPGYEVSRSCHLGSSEVKMSILAEKCCFVGFRPSKHHLRYF